MSNKWQHPYPSHFPSPHSNLFSYTQRRNAGPFNTPGVGWPPSCLSSRGPSASGSSDGGWDSSIKPPLGSFTAASQQLAWSSHLRGRECHFLLFCCYLLSSVTDEAPPKSWYWAEMPAWSHSMSTFLTTIYFLLLITKKIIFGTHFRYSIFFSVLRVNLVSHFSRNYLYGPNLFLPNQSSSNMTCFTWCYLL